MPEFITLADGSFWVEYSRIKLEFGTEATLFSYAPEDEEVN